MSPFLRRLVIGVVLILIPGLALLFLLPRPYGLFTAPYGLIMAGALITARRLRSQSADKRPPP
jgi:hypothetical protein